MEELLKAGWHFHNTQKPLTPHWRLLTI
jgi:hypothetical protein